MIALYAWNQAPANHRDVRGTPTKGCNRLEQMQWLVDQSEGVTVIGLSADDPQERQTVSRAMQGLSYPAALLVDAKTNGFGTPRALPIT